MHTVSTFIQIYILVFLKPNIEEQLNILRDKLGFMHHEGQETYLRFVVVFYTKKKTEFYNKEKSYNIFASQV